MAWHRGGFQHLGFQFRAGRGSAGVSAYGSPSIDLTTILRENAGLFGSLALPTLAAKVFNPHSPKNPLSRLAIGS
jgi:hypothetical protein